ncbi:hypothetical protein EVAR_12484_1 [Eumeta japonica]|uniref:Uncharacterized protein n=1 Tax=Eumeta variegata TaxID=151549 RepID=A0A4C1TPI8_EUMVA|nr:hypothetical protein EVAR_12484_1 [Eumeta japonica]
MVPLTSRCPVSARISFSLKLRSAATAPNAAADDHCHQCDDISDTDGLIGPSKHEARGSRQKFRLVTAPPTRDGGQTLA